MKPPTEEQLDRLRSLVRCVPHPLLGSLLIETDLDALKAILAHREALVAEVARLTEERGRLRRLLDKSPDDCLCDCYDGPEPDFDAPSFRETYELAHREKRRVRGL